MQYFSFARAGSTEVIFHDRMAMRWVLTFLAIDLLVGCTAILDEKSVKTSLEARWTHTSFIAETSEFLANEDANHFWSYINQLATGMAASNWSIGTNEEEYGHAIKYAKPFLSSSKLDLLKFALSLRIYSPKVQVFQQIATSYSSEFSNCANFVDINGKVTCNMDDIDIALRDAATRETPKTYSIDHFHPKSKDKADLPIAILYADIGSPQFLRFHNKLKELSNKVEARYAFRHFKAESEEDIPVGLSGYGVELAIKNTEYKAIDDSKVEKSEEEEDMSDVKGFNFNILRKNHEHLRDSLKQLKIHLSEMEELAPLKQWEVADLSFQAAQQIMSATPEEALTTLADLSQNFPIRARSLVQTKVRKALRDEIQSNQERFNNEFDVSEGDSALFLNGMTIDVDSLDIFQLFNTINQEESLANAFFSMGFRREYLSILYNLDLSEDKTSYGIDYREAYPEYINDLDKDKGYKEWGNSVKLLLQPYFPGMIRPIARNLFTMICIIDPAAPESRVLLKIAHSLYMHQVPLRIGFVFVLDSDSHEKSGKEHVGIALLNLYNFAKSDKTPAKAINLVAKLLDQYVDSKLAVDDVHKFFLKHFPDQDIDDVFQLDSDYNTGRTAGQNFMKQSGLQSLPKVLLNGVLLDDSSLHADKIEEAILLQIMKQTSPLQRAVAMGKLTDKDNVQNWILNQPDILPRLNNRLLKEPTSYLSLFDVNPCNANTVREFGKIKPEERSQCVLEKARYLTKNDNEETKWLNIWLVADFSTAHGRDLLLSGLKALKKSNHLRLSLIQNGDNPNGLSAALIIHGIFHSMPSTMAKQMLNKLLTSEETVIQVLKKGDLEKISVHGVNTDDLKKYLYAKSTEEELAIQSYFAQNDLQLGKGESAVVVNGMIYGPLGPNEDFETQDFFLLEKILERKGAKAVAMQIDQWDVSKEGGKSSDVVLRSVAVIGKYAAKKKRHYVEFTADLESVVNLVAQDGSRPIIEIVAIVDPLSRSAQKMATILRRLTNVLNCDLRMAMNPKGRLSELPLKRFYRYTLKEEPRFNTFGRLLTPTVSFKELPAKQLLTLNMIAPSPWMVQPVYAEHDLDNIIMKNAKKDVIAKFELVHILLEGHCFDEVTGNPPRGLQYTLGTQKEPSRYDTIVMANLGYFQLKASPGAWELRLREGKSNDIYEIKTCTDAEMQSNEKASVIIDTFQGKTLRIRVAKRPGMENRNLLTSDSNEKGDNAIEDDEGESGGSLWSSISNKLAGGEKHDKINIFSLASGHLYERFLQIMMLSVMKNTKHPVKFWLLNNYLSPIIRKTLPKMAEKYGFEYELIEYKWPKWLHQQTEKQRVMWGYKILFLDVLFPLDVKKIIFVDADQVVRTDMMELMNLDLGGAPYGYVPFCESRTSMDGFRFWKQGYWANHMAGRKYHISALYVVDLQKFRQIAAGDRLRGQYQGLSSDPNSLSNLDQDLPNNMIHQVRIKSLPQEWLWCETWCDEDSKKSAKTIDLCNNPLTKEPKLDSAIRIIPEWTAYDNEIKALNQEEETQQKQTIDKAVPQTTEADHGGEL